MQEGKVLARATNAKLGTRPTTVTLEGREIAPLLDALGSRRLRLVLRGLRASRPPGVLYHLYLNLPTGAVPAHDDPRHGGIINFYAAQTGDPDPDRIFYSFDVTQAARSLQTRGLLRGPLTVTFYPFGHPEPGAEAIISRLELIAE